MPQTDPRDAQIAALREEIVRLRELLSRTKDLVETASCAGLASFHRLNVEIQAALAAAPAAKRDVPCKTPGCNYAMVPLEEDGWYVCTKCRAVHQVLDAAKREVGE